MQSILQQRATDRNSRRCDILSLKDYAQIAVDLDATAPFMIGGRANG
jgi:hypothetical protein